MTTAHPVLTQSQEQLLHIGSLWEASFEGERSVLCGTLTSWTSLGPRVNGSDSPAAPREDPVRTRRHHIHTCTSFLYFWVCSHMEMPTGGEVRPPEGTVKQRRDSTPPKATKTEENSVSKGVNETGKYLLFCSPVPFPVFHSRAQMFFHPPYESENSTH